MDQKGLGQKYKKKIIFEICSPGRERDHSRHSWGVRWRSWALGSRLPWGQVIPSSLKFIRPLFPDRQLLFMLSVSSWIPWWCPQVVQQNGNGDNLEDGPKVTWLGYSLLPEGKFCLLPLGFPYSNFIWGVFSKIWFPGTEIKFPLIFTEDLTFDLDPYQSLQNLAPNGLPKVYFSLPSNQGEGHIA